MVQEQGGILTEMNPVHYNNADPIVLFIVQVTTSDKNGSYSQQKYPIHFLKFLINIRKSNFSKYFVLLNFIDLLLTGYVTQDMYCTRYTQKLHSIKSIWILLGTFNDWRDLNSSSIPLYKIPPFWGQIVLIVIVTRGLDQVLSKLLQPRVISEIIGGIILGPSVLGIFPALRPQYFRMNRFLI